MFLIKFVVRCATWVYHLVRREPPTTNSYPDSYLDQVEAAVNLDDPIHPWNHTDEISPPSWSLNRFGGPFAAALSTMRATKDIDFDDPELPRKIEESHRDHHN